MKFFHHNLQIKVDDTWWTEAAMEGFVPLTRAYHVNANVAKGRKLFEIRIDEVRPVRRNPGIGIFNDNEETTAKERVISILRGFRVGSAIPPVEVVFEPTDSPFRYKLVAGVHRFYCSLAAGFSHVPAVQGWEPEDRAPHSKLKTRN
jgi:hypothetical protein